MNDKLRILFWYFVVKALDRREIDVTFNMIFSFPINILTQQTFSSLHSRQNMFKLLLLHRTFMLRKLYAVFDFHSLNSFPDRWKFSAKSFRNRLWVTFEIESQKFSRRIWEGTHLGVRDPLHIVHQYSCASPGRTSFVSPGKRNFMLSCVNGQTPNRFSATILKQWIDDVYPNLIREQ